MQHHRIWLLCLLLLGAGMARGAEAAPESPAERILLVLGDSLAAGYGVAPDEAWPARLGRRIADAGLPFTVVNAGLSGDTTAGGRRRITWQLRRPVDVLLVELGGNDGLRGIPAATTRSNLLAIVESARAKHPDLPVVLAGMQMPPSMGPDYVREFAAVFPEVARSTGATLIPHLLEGVGGIPRMNQHDLIHPTPEGHERVARNVWKVLEPVLRAAVRKDE